MKITKISRLSGKDNTMEIPFTDEQFKKYERWFKGEGLIQNMLPHLSADQREFLMTGITSEEWKDIFK